MNRIAMAVVVVAQVAAAQQSKKDVAAELAQLQQEVALQRQLLSSLLQDQQQRAALLLQLLGTSRSGGVPSMAPAPAEDVLPMAPSVANGPSSRRAPPGRTLSGRVTGVGGAPLPEGSWVFIQDVSAPARGVTLEVLQQNKAFVPAAAVVQRGTHVLFTNADAVFHDVFSHSPSNAFEIGAVRGGAKPQPVALSRPGLVDVFCNFHAKMSAQILVVPGPYFAKVDEQGTFKLENVPAGRHTLAAWSPNAKVVTVAVDVASDVADLEIQVAPEREVRAHLNKSERAYGSYEP